MARRESQKGTQTLKVKPKITQNPNYQNLLEHSWKKQKKTEISLTGWLRMMTQLNTQKIAVRQQQFFYFTPSNV